MWRLQVTYIQTPASYAQLVSLRRGATTKYYHFDGLGSTTELTDADETETDSFRYKAFGQALSTSGTTKPPFRYVGKLGYYWHSDTEIDMDYVRARYYRPCIGRFISQDPILTLGSPYAYAINRPVSWVDVSGLQPLPDPPWMTPPEPPKPDCEAIRASAGRWAQEVLAVPEEQRWWEVEPCPGLVQGVVRALNLGCVKDPAGWGPYETASKWCLCGGCIGPSCPTPAGQPGTDHDSVPPDTNRFIFIDPYRDGINWYANVANNPINSVDPSGQILCSECKKIKSFWKKLWCRATCMKDEWWNRPAPPIPGPVKNFPCKRIRPLCQWYAEGCQVHCANYARVEELVQACQLWCMGSGLTRCLGEGRFPSVPPKFLEPGAPDFP